MEDNSSKAVPHSGKLIKVTITMENGKEYYYYNSIKQHRIMLDYSVELGEEGARDRRDYFERMLRESI